MRMKMVSLKEWQTAPRVPEQRRGGDAAAAKIFNAFAIETKVTARPLSGNERFQLFLGVYQGQNGAKYHVICVQRGQ